MSTCTIPPSGWKCSREPGHEGSCAASRIFPYDEYADRIINSGRLAGNLRLSWYGSPMSFYDISERELRRLLTEAWLEGMDYSLELIKREAE